MRKELSVKNLAQFFWQLEERYRLFEWQVDGVFVWPVVRYKLFNRLLLATATFEPAHPWPRSIAHRLRFAGWLVYSFLFKNPLRSRCRAENVVLPLTRKAAGSDPFCQQLLGEIKNSATIIDTAWLNSPQAGSYSLDFYRVVSRLKGVVAALFKNRGLSCETAASVEKEFVNRLGPLNFSFHDFLQREVAAFKLLTKAYHGAFRRIAPERLYLVCGYCKIEAIAAAQKLGIKVVELQHGVINRYHPGYSFPGHNQIPYFPDEILFFGNYWVESTTLPRNTVARVVGAPYIYQKLAAAKLSGQSNRRTAKSVIFCSAPTIGRKLFTFALDLSRLLSDYQLIFRLHPDERADSYAAALKESGVENLRLSQKGEDTHQLLAESEIQAGVYSMSMFEGLLTGNRLIFIKLPGYEYLLEFISRENLPLVATPAEFVERLNDARGVESYSEYLADPVSRIT